MLNGFKLSIVPAALPTVWAFILEPPIKKDGEEGGFRGLAFVEFRLAGFGFPSVGNESFGELFLARLAFGGLVFDELARRRLAVGPFPYISRRKRSMLPAISLSSTVSLALVPVSP